MATARNFILYRYCINIALCVSTGSVLANTINTNTHRHIDIETQLITGNNTASYQTHLADMTAKLNLVTLEEDTSSSALSDTGLIDIDLNNSTQLSIGKKNIQYSSLIYLQDYSQGISSNINLPVFNSRFKTFTTSTNNFNHNNLDTTLGIEDHNNRASGIIWEYQPVTAEEEQLSFTTSYLSGESEVDNHGGDAVSFTTSASAFNQSLILRGEYAQSSFKATHTDAQNNTGTQEAQHYFISYKPAVKKNNDKGIWDIGIEKKTIDAQFQPIFNRNLPKDRDITRLFGHYEKKQWSTEASFSQEKNNLHNKLNTTDNVRSGTFIGRYKQKAFDPKKKRSLLGQQEYSLQYHQSNKIQRYHFEENSFSLQDDWQSAANSPNSNHNKYHALSLEGRHHYASWQWFYRGGHAQASDRLDTNGHFRSNELELGTQFSMNPVTTIDAKIRSLNSRKIVAALSSSEINYGLSLNRALTPDKTAGKLELNYHQRNSEVTTSDSEQHQTLVISGNISHRLLVPKGIYPSIDLNLSAHYRQEKNAFADINQKDYQALLDIKVSWVSSQNTTTETEPPSQ